MSNRFRNKLVPLVILLLLAGCSATPRTLDSKPAAVPAGLDLSGQWQLRGGVQPQNRQFTDDTPIVPKRRSRQSRSTARGQDTTAHVFLEHGKSLKISQTPYSLFISYDRSVVEEYTFGENRLVNVGPIEARRVSGWEQGAFVVETLDSRGTTLFETWHLESDDVLVRDIRIVDDDERKSFEQQQYFDRS